MRTPIGEGESVVGKFEQVVAPASRLEGPHRAQVLGKRNGIDVDVTLVHIHHRREDMRVRRPEEVLRSQPRRNLLDGLLVQHAGGKHRFFGFDIVRPPPVRRVRRIRRILRHMRPPLFCV